MIYSLLATLVASFAFAAPVVDPEIIKVYQRDSSQRTAVPTIITFQDLAAPRAMGPSTQNYRNMRYVLDQNAQASQRRVCQLLTGLPSCRGPQVKSYWLTNTVFAYLTQRQAQQVVQFPEVTGLIHAHRQIQLVRPVDVRAVTSYERMAQGDYTYGLRNMKIPEFRAQFPQITGKGVNVGVLDTGIAPQHPEFQGKRIVFKDFTGSKTEPYDDHGHGTHVAGTIGGIGANGTQIGVAPGVNFTIAKILGGGGSGSLDGIIQGMNWVADPDGNPNTPDAPSIINNSWGGGRSSSMTDPITNIQCKAVENWLRLGILPVFAAGNSGSGASTILLPGACPRSFTIGATDAKDIIANFSSRGPAKWSTGNVMKPEVSAPGVQVMSASHRGGYVNMSGTSMAAPHAAGMAALVVQMNPGIAVDAVSKMMIQMTKDLGQQGPDNDYGFGRLQMTPGRRY